MPLQSRASVFDYLERYCEDRKHDLDGRRRTQGPLLKTYLLETSDDGNSLDRFDDSSQRFRVDKLNGELWVWIDTERNAPIAWVEPLEHRFLAVYSNEKVQDIEKSIHEVVDDNAFLDRVWLSASALFSFWERLQTQAPPYRFVRMRMQFDASLTRDIEDLFGDFGDLDVAPSEWKSLLELNEQVQHLKALMPRLRELPLEAFHSPRMLRLPSPRGGGHELYYNGKVTNRTPSFRNHRSYLQVLLRWYRACTEEIEFLAWPSSNETGWSGANPVTLRFSSQLQPVVFENVVEKVFKRGNKPFRIWGNPIQVGANHYHLYGLDEHLWQEIFLDISTVGIEMLLPRRTCGNTVHRLITHLQRNVDPRLKAWIGNTSYDGLLHKHLTTSDVENRVSTTSYICWETPMPAVRSRMRP